MKTFKIIVTNTKDQNYLKDYIYRYRHWQNILTVLAINLFKSNNSDYKHFLDYAIVRVCITNTKMDKKKEDSVAYIKEKYKYNELYKVLIKVGQKLKTHNLVEIVKRLKNDFSNYFKALKDCKNNLSKYIDLPQLPKAKKLSQLINYLIPLDSYCSISFKKKNYTGINLSKKMRYFYIGKTDKTDIFKKSETISEEAIEFKNSKTGVKWSLKGNYLKRFKTYLTQKRNDYFKNSFHKLSKKVVEYLQLHNVTHLVISSSLAELKNSGNYNLRKSVKQHFIQIPFIQLLKYIEEKAKDANIKVIRADEAYTSKTSCISEDVCDVQEYSNDKSQEKSTCTIKPKYNDKRTKRDLFKETIIDKIFNADLNGAVNHIKLAIKQSFQ